MHYQIKASHLQGGCTIPPSKSHTLRAILFASLATGQSHIHRYLHSPDTVAMIQACRLLGAKIYETEDELTIEGTSGKPQTPPDVINAGNSGQVLRFIAAVVALCPGYTVLTGDASIRSNRPIQPLLDGLTKLNVMAVSTQNNQYAPIIIRGPLVGGQTQLSGEDSQPVSGLLIAAAFAPQPTTIEVISPGETPWLALTLDWLSRLGINVKHTDYQVFEVPGGAEYAGFDYTVPGDFSSCAFPLAAALVTQSRLCLNGIDMRDIQGDKALVIVLQSMGAQVRVDETQSQLIIETGGVLRGGVVNVNAMIDALPILAVLACFASQETIITGAAIARQKESNRLAAITNELTKMGALITETADGLIIKPATLHGAVVDSHHDHRIAMALVVAGLAATGVTMVNDIACVAKSYPHFVRDFCAMGAALVELI